MALQQAIVLATYSAVGVTPCSCHPDIKFRMLIHNCEKDESSVKSYLSSSDFECRNLLVEHYGLSSGSWFERDRLIQALQPFKESGSWDLQTLLLSRVTKSPQVAKVCHDALRFVLSAKVGGFTPASMLQNGNLGEGANIRACHKMMASHDAVMTARTKEKT
eukprot:m.176329 g.176329  ORF g.176329 m.176329 type:complete len:162 (+) comp14896_c1_seq1:650-1135(+)